MHLRPAAADGLGAAWTRHRFLDRPASQTRNATKHNDTQPKHNNTHPTHNKTQPKPIKTQTKHNHTQIGPNPQSAEGGGAKHIIIIITEVSLGVQSKWSLPSACSQVALDRAARTSLVNSPATVNLADAGPRAHCDNKDKDKLLLGLLELSFLLCFAPRYVVKAGQTTSDGIPRPRSR